MSFVGIARTLRDSMAIAYRIEAVDAVIPALHSESYSGE
jgi:hypothetical protein